MPLIPLDETLTARLADTLPEGCLTAAGPAYLQEPRGRFHGLGPVVAKPHSTEEVARIVRFCSEHSVGIVPYAGGTGLVSGQIMEHGPAPLILSLERMTAIRELRDADNVMICEAGAILADVQAAAEAADRLFPLSMASEGSCRIGGNLATNAGGVNVLRYGNARELCLGIEAVMADGSVFHGLRALRKDNTGYDLRNLLVGSEGTLGIITAAALKLFPKPREYATAFAAVAGPSRATELLAFLQDRLDGAVSGFEIMHQQGLAFLAEVMPQVRLPFAKPPEWSLLIEATGGSGSDIAERMTEALAEKLEAGVIEDVVLAQSEAQRQALWEVRESMPEANRIIGSVSSHDISVPIRSIEAFVAEANAAILALGDLRINCFGHLGDGNLHYNVFPAKGRDRADYVDLRERVKETVHDLVHAYGGSVSAEHGIGRLKVMDLEKYGDPAKLAAMRAIKAALDPKGILNPGAVLRAG